MVWPGVFRRWVAGLMVTTLGACASVPPGAFDRTVRGETIEGRISVRYTVPQTGKDDGSSGSFVWTTDGDRLELSLLDPLGQTVALVRSDAGRSSITLRDGRTVDGDTAEELTARTLGFAVPLGGLRYWLLGRADPSRPSATSPDAQLQQDGWTLRFQRDEGAPSDGLPKRIDLLFAGPPARIDLRLVVDRRGAT